MSDEQPTNENPTGENDGGHDDDRDTSGLPKWARNSLSKANNEAAKFRNELREKTEEHTQALAKLENLSGQVSQVESQRDSALADLNKLRTVLEAGVPGGQALALASRLQGTTDEELKADAEALVKQFNLDKAPRVPAYDPTQGRGGDPSGREKPSTPEGAFAQTLADHLRNLR